MKWIRYWLPAVVWMVIIFFFSTNERVSVSSQPVINFLFFKTLHVIEYAILFVLYVRSLHLSITKKSVVNNFAVAFLLTILYAITAEIHQAFVPTRQGQPRDVIIDTFGAILAWYFLTHVLPKAPKKLQQWAENWQLI